MARGTAQPELLRKINRSKLLSILESGELISRAELARRSGLSRATVSSIIDDLLNLGLLQEKKLGNSDSGRPPILLAFVPTAWFAIGAEMTESEWVLVLVDLQAQVVRQTSVSFSSPTPEEVLAALDDGFDKIRDKFPGRILPALGLGLPGLVDDKTGVIESAADLGWFEVPFRDMAQHRLKTKVYVINRHKAAGLVEAQYGSGVNADNLVYVGIGTGVAAAIFMEGTLVRGANSSAGELGHVTVEPNGHLCPCGNRGCLQQYVSGPALAARARELIKEGNESMLEICTKGNLQMITGGLVCEAAAMGDKLSMRLIEEAAKYLGIAISNVVNMLNPNKIVLGGPIGRKAGDLLLKPLRDELKRRSMSHPYSVLEVTTATMGEAAAALGAAGLVLNNKLELMTASN